MTNILLIAFFLSSFVDSGFNRLIEFKKLSNLGESIFKRLIFLSEKSSLLDESINSSEKELFDDCLDKGKGECDAAKLFSFSCLYFLYLSKISPTFLTLSNSLFNSSRSVILPSSIVKLLLSLDVFELAENGE